MHRRANGRSNRPKKAASQEARKMSCDEYEVIGRRKDAILRSYVNPSIGLYIFNCAFKEKQQTLGG